ncbi:MAG: cupin domain-containing protein [Lacunisphaera sp.]|nr:cupin domain-containing protein [Lacunisphaera sp.]
MKILRCALFLLGLPLSVWAGYSTDPDSGLFFNDSKYTFTVPADASIYHGVKTALLLDPEDLSERSHYSNSNMARLELHEILPGGGAHPYMIEDFREQIFIILKGEVDFSAGKETLHARTQDVVFIPPGILRGFTVTGNASARVLQAEWRQKGLRPEKTGRAYVTSERVHGLTRPSSEGYLTVTPNPRQHGNPLSIISYGGGHINAGDDLLFYHLDMSDPRPFTANTKLAAGGLQAYYPGGGTVWHFHPDREQAFVILSGKALFEIGANTIEVKGGDIVFAPRHVGHGYKTMGDEPLKFFHVEWGRH